MNLYAVLLRGINTGGMKLNMEELKDLARQLGYQNPQTILATGNLLLQTEESVAEVQEKIEAKLAEHMGKPVHCLVRTLEELEQILRESDLEIEGYHHYILFVKEPLMEELAQLHQDYKWDSNEQIFANFQDIHWIVAKGNTLQGFGSKVLGSKKFKERLTSRNIATVKKIVTKLSAMK
ncbi:MAG: DUF1697 domain-containing protein [Tissierellia bacterium]|nr:DUF1697 domain-containing protein [Tissierellia bacterium]